ncbi:MAG TPA: aspartate/glutamate racemase family protein [Candidatus Saccharibacteria bacterium]|nr:aspartate/glutamate racemase family protein [Candidatus Saccharibacteria bacterium]
MPMVMRIFLLGDYKDIFEIKIVTKDNSMSSDKKIKHILILGGMGPQASVYAHMLLLKAATKNGAVNNEDYPRITHLSVNVKDFIGSPVFRDEACNYLARCLRGVDTTSVDAAFIACNTAHVLQSELESASGLQFTSLVDTTAEAITDYGHVKSLGILATPSTLKSGLYSSRLSKITTVIEPTAESSRKLELIIRDVIGGGDETSIARRLGDEVNALIERGAQRVVLGCTELSLAGSRLDGGIMIDPLSLTVQKVLRDE